MRFVLFYSGIESFNYFTNQLAEEIGKRGYDYFVLDLNKMSDEGQHSFAEFTKYLSQKVDVAIGFDGLGLKEDLFIELWDSMNTMAVNILMDHPLRFHPTMQKHPKKYIQFCCDRNHVEYVHRYFGTQVSDVEFMPHAGTYMGEPDFAGYQNRPYDVLFSGTFYEPKNYLEQISRDFSENDLLKEFYFNLSSYMIENTSVTTEQAVLDMIEKMRLSLQPEQVKTLFRCAEPIDWMVRMYYRKQVIDVIATSGISLWLLGRGWENHPAAALPNVHILNDRVPFAETLPIMAKAKINLNVMPWFKDGTHDRIFNILLQGSLPLTDESLWLKDNFSDGKDIVFYDLNRLEELPEKIEECLNNTDRTERMIRTGFEKVKNNFVWESCVSQILDAVNKVI